jgi:hypothetical protein
MTSGVFFRRLAAAASAAHPLHLDVTGDQLAPPAGHGARVHAQQLGDLGVAAVADLQCLQARVQAPLAFVEQAVEQHDGGLELVGQHPHTRAQPQCRRFGVVDLPGGQLPPPDRRVGRQVHVAAADCLSGYTPGADQREKRLLALHVQDGLELAGVISGVGRPDQRLDRRQQRPEPREPHRAERPQPQVIKSGDLIEGVEAAPMRVAGAVGQLGQLAEHGGVGLAAQRLF